jgi:hypothetical protein
MGWVSVLGVVLVKDFGIVGRWMRSESWEREREGLVVKTWAHNPWMGRHGVSLDC